MPCIEAPCCTARSWPGLLIPWLEGLTPSVLAVVRRSELDTPSAPNGCWRIFRWRWSVSGPCLRAPQPDEGRGGTAERVAGPFPEQQSVIPGEVAGIEEPPGACQRLDPRRFRIAGQQQAAHRMQPLQFQVGHGPHAEMVAEALDQAATACVHLPAEGSERDRLLRMFRHPALGRFHQLDPCRRPEHGRLQLRSKDQGLQQQRHEIVAGDPLPAGKRGELRPRLHRQEEPQQMEAQPRMARSIQRHPVAAQCSLVQIRPTQRLRPFLETVPGEQHHRQVTGGRRGEVNLAAGVETEQTGRRQRLAMGPHGRARTGRTEGNGDDLMSRGFLPHGMDRP